jgi:hypothetical protein
MNQQDLNNAIKEGIALKKQANKLIDDANLKSIQEIANFKKTNEAYTDIVKRLKEVNTEVKEARDTQKELIGQYAQQESRLKGLTGLQSSLSELESKRIQKMANMGKLDENRRKTFDTIASLQNDLLNTSAEDVIAQADINRQLDEQYKDLEGVRGTHAHIAKNLRQQRQIAEGVASLTEKQQKFLSNQLAVYEGIQDTIGGVLETAQLLTSTTGGMFGSALIGAGMFADKLGETTKALGGMREFGTTALSFIDGNAVENAKALSKEFGGMNNVTAELQVSTSLISSNMGISGTEAASLLGTFSRLNGNSTDVAKDLMVSTQEFAKQNGIIPSELMADLANNTEAFALYGKDGGKNIIQAAGYAKKLGVEFSKLTGIADNLLDFESSITKELELGAMLGRNINLDRARALAFEGKIEEATKETLNALGGIEEFNKMDPFAKKASADLLGVSVGELEKMVANQKEADTLSGQLNEKFSFLSEGASYIANEWGGGILKGMGSALIAAGQLGGSFAQMGVDVKGMAKSSFDFVKNLFKGNALAKAQKTFSDKQISAGFAGKKAKDMLSSKMGDVTTKLPETSITDSANPAKKGGMMDSMSKIKMNDVLKGAAALVIVAAAVFVFGKAVQEFMKVSWEAVGMAVVSMLALVGAVTALGLLMSSGIGAVAILAGAAAMLVIATSVLVLGNALQTIGTGFEMLSSGITTLLPNLVGVGTTISSLMEFIPAISELSLSLLGLAGSLVAVGAAGLLATPGLLALSTVGAIATGIGSVLGIGGDTATDNGSETMKMLLDEIKGLRTDLNSGKIAVYMDGTAVTSKISKVVDRIGVNSYS